MDRAGCGFQWETMESTIGLFDANGEPFVFMPAEFAGNYL